MSSLVKRRRSYEGACERRGAWRHAAALAATLAAATLFSSCGSDTYTGRKMIVLGFDGMDYELSKRLIAEGRLPNLERLAKEGSFTPLETSVPPESPVAWSSFTTGLDPGGHGIFDFIHRDPKTLFPYAADRETLPEGLSITLGGWHFPLTGGGFRSLRHGEPFWAVLEENGIESWILRMPANFPTSGLATRELSGMGTDDIRGMPGSFSYYTTELFYPTEGLTGGEAFEWDVYDGVAEQKLYAADNPLRVHPERLTIDFQVYVDPNEPLVKIVVDDEERLLQVGEWSDWVPLEFELMPTQTLHAICRFYLKSVEPELELYVTPLNYDPMLPDSPISTPPSFATELALATGRFYTQGMPEDTKALTNGVMDVPWFVNQAEIAGEEIRRQYDYVLDTFDGGFLFYYTGNLDQVSHVMWASMDPGHPQYEEDVYGPYEDLIPSLYEGLDEMVGHTLETMDEDTTLIVMSDHGFATWRRSFNLNRWLVENGYMALKNPNLAEDPGFFGNVDWTGTRAYAMGINGLYVNLRGREKNGIVEPNDRQALLDELEADLLSTLDPETGEPAVTRIYQREKIYSDRHSIDIGPDIQMGYAKGVRGSGKGALGDIEPEVLRDNTDDWTGDHIMDHEAVPGVLFTSRRLKRPAPSLQSLAPAILAEFGIEDPFPRPESP